ncbi:MAG: Do family serine endopeptidase [Acidobacteriota bacterium]|nr:Do family serine endopeptidase [Acidobacteriota bacterium]
MSFFDKVRRQKFLSFTLILFTLSIGVLIGTLLNTGVKAAKDQSAAPGATALSIPSPVQLQNSFSQLAKVLEPSVVNISTEYMQKAAVNLTTPHGRRRMSPVDPDEQDNGMQDFLQRFFGGGGGGMGGMDGEMPQTGPRRSFALGSGVVVDRNGYILTNNHVVEKATRVKVKFTDDPTDYEAKVIGTDPFTDLAVIKIDRKDLVPAKIGNSDAMNVGDWAIAIGSPFGFQATVTAGIISAKQRDIPGESTGNFQHFLQTDAAINPGNSGGPLLNINGEVIGINTMIASRSGGYQGIGFAMPINTAVKVYNQIIKTGHIVRGSIGIKFPANDETRDLLKAYGATNGVFVQSVEPNGPADKASIKSEDIITAINGKPVHKGQDLIDTVADSPIGTNLTMSLLRNGKKEDVTVTIGDRAKVFPDELGAVSQDDNGTGEATQAKFGIQIQNLNDQLRQTLGFKDKSGVLVSTVEPGSFAEDIGLVKNDIIESINRQPVNGVEDVKRIQNTLKTGQAVAFRVMRSAGARGGNWQPIFLAGTLPNSVQ